MKALLQAACLLVMVVFVASDFLAALLNLSILVMIVHFFTAYTNENTDNSSNAGNSLAYATPATKKHGANRKRPSKQPKDDSPSSHLTSNSHTLASSPDSAPSDASPSTTPPSSNKFKGKKIRFDNWDDLEPQHGEAPGASTALAVLEKDNNDMQQTPSLSRSAKSEEHGSDAVGSSDLEEDSTYSEHDSLASVETEDLAPEPTLGERFTTLASWGWDREMAIRENHPEPGELTEENLAIMKRFGQLYQGQFMGLYYLDAFLHAPNYIPFESEAECDNEVVGPGWDLPPATIDPITGEVLGGLEAEDREQVNLDSNCRQYVLLRITDPVGIYVFPNYHKIEFRGRIVRKPRVVRNATSDEINKSYTYQFNLGDMMGGLTICSTQELPKMYIDYHVYTEKFPQGFPDTAAQAVWSLDQMSPMYISDAVTRHAPYVTTPEYRAYFGSSFTIQPLNILSPAHYIGRTTKDDPRLSRNACHQGMQNWSFKLRAGNRLMQVGIRNRGTVAAEPQPWEDANAITSSLDPTHVYLPLEGFFHEQDGGQSREIFAEVMNGQKLKYRGRFHYNKPTQAWKEAQRRARTDSPSSCDDAIRNFMAFLPVHEFITPHDEGERLRMRSEHLAQNREPCLRLRREAPPGEWCNCGDISENPYGSDTTPSMNDDEGDVVHVQGHLVARPIHQQWIEHVQHWLQYYVEDKDEDGEQNNDGEGEREDNDEDDDDDGDDDDEDDETENRGAVKFSWAGDDGFLLNNKGKNERNDPSLLRKSGFFPEEKTAPSPTDFLANFRFVTDGPVHNMISRLSTIEPPEQYPWDVPPEANQSAELA